MFFRLLDGDGDWTFGQGLSGFAYSQDAINLDIKTELLSWVGDCFFALTDGIDWVNRLNYNQEANLVTEIQNKISQRLGVLQVNNVSTNLNRTTRSITIKYSIQTIYGPLQDEIILLAGG